MFVFNILYHKQACFPNRNAKLERGVPILLMSSQSYPNPGLLCLFRPTHELFIPKTRESVVRLLDIGIDSGRLTVPALWSSLGIAELKVISIEGVRLPIQCFNIGQLRKTLKKVFVLRTNITEYQLSARPSIDPLL